MKRAVFVATIVGGILFSVLGQSSPRETLARGYWSDPSTGLMWTTQDNGRDISWGNAVNYCQNLLAEVNKNPTAAKRDAVTQQIRNLQEMVSFEAEFSATAAECLRSRKEQWAQRLASVAQAA